MGGRILADTYCAAKAAAVRAADALHRMTQPAGAPQPSTTAQLTVLTGPSGVGKGTLVRGLLARHPALWLSVSATTRSPRAGEVDGEHYFFLTPERFARQLEEGGFLEWAAFAGNRYGTPRAPVEKTLAAGRPVLLEIEVEGARQVRRSFPAARQIFVAPPSLAELERRIRGRGTDGEEAIQRRLARAREELAAAAEFDAVLINDDLEAAGQELDRLMGLAAGGDLV
jgi:guanylate kinase